MKVNNKQLFEMNRIKLSTLSAVESNIGTMSVSACGESIDGIKSSINGVDCIISKQGIKIFKGALVDSPQRAMRIMQLSEFFMWKDGNTYEVLQDCVINDLIIAQILLGGTYLGGATIPMFEGSDEIDFYRYFYTEDSENDCREKVALYSPSRCKYAGKLIVSPHRLHNYNQDALVLDKSRVKQHGEVLTPPNIVSDMLDMVGKEYNEKLGMSEGTLPLKETFLEPACGTGNFLVQILQRKLRNASNQAEIFQAVATIYGIDIQKDNVLESRLRMLEIVEDRCDDEKFLSIIADVLEKNIVGGDFLSAKWGCMIEDKWVSGYVSNRTGSVEEDNIAKTHGRIVMYNWKWHDIDHIDKTAEFLNEES